MDMAIVGGGIGGLTLAVALHQRGIPCRVYESAPEVRELGVGITLLPHGMRELTAHAVGQQGDAHAQLSHLGGALVDAAGDAALMQREREGEPADAAADDRDVHVPDFRPWCAECSLGGLRSAGRWG